VGQMVRLVDDLLDVSRISQGKITLRRERVELALVLNQAVEAALPHCARMEQQLTVTLPPQPIYLNVDPTRLAQIIGNLLNNACKYSDSGGCIRLTVELDHVQSVIRVQDSGIGIAADQLSRIFEMFMQVDSSLERAQGGLGIGLTLVRKLVEMHGGTVQAYSTGLAEGAEFVVRLPVSTAPLVPPERSGLEPAVKVGRRILVVDDNQDSASSLAMLLELGGHDVYTAHDGIDAVEAAAKLKPEVIVLDIGLPGIDGYEAARRIRQQREAEGLVLVALTGWGQDEDKRRSLEAGFDFHLIKPVDPDVLEKLLDSLAPP
ncbi:MAG: ATP-binding protein, partial [Burkholderiales bacterium]